MDTSRKRRHRRRLHDMNVKKVSVVDEAANLRQFLLIKNRKGKTMSDMTIEEIEDQLDPEIVEALFDPDILKALDPKAAKAVAAAVSRLQGVKSMLPKGLQSAVDRLAAALGSKEKTGYPPPGESPGGKTPVKKNLGEDDETPEWAQALVKRLDGIEEHLGLAPDQLISMADAERVAREAVAEALESVRKGEAA